MYTRADPGEGNSAGRFEVRGRDDSDLWIVVHRPSGATFHRLVPDARGKYGKQETRGMSIEGRIEGHYATGSNNGSGYEYWKPYK